MSLTLEVRVGKHVQQWAVSNAAIEGLVHIVKDGLDAAVQVLWDERTPYGRQRRVDRDKLLAAIDGMMPSANTVAKGFHMRFRFPGHAEGSGKGTRGIVINGASYWIWCEEEFWTLTPDAVIGDDITEFYRNKGPPRRDSAEFQTENMGVVRIEPKKGKSDVAKLLADVRKFVRAAKGNTALITIG